ncbi:hypothetical protein ACFPK9_05285 [Rubritalea spongiae]|uniref:Uncharacterized protein n=1 Tax=Rubritalea spongiae TaxID=430797 RepID=A0ABW5E4M1_9BACT
MSKLEKTVILPSEEDGWEVWKLRDSVATHDRFLEGAVCKADKQQDSCVAFSITRVATLPVLVPSTDPEIYRGAAELELENAGLLVDVENYQGWDCILVEKREEESFISAVYLLEDELNEANDLRQHTFDYSARYYRPSVEGDCIALWRERHRWCMTCYRNGIPFLTEPLGEELVDLTLSLHLTISQLSLKGIQFKPAEVFLWSVCEQAENVAAQVMAAGLVLTEEDRPAPSVPAGEVNLEPSVVSEWRKQVANRKRLKGIGIGVAAIYLIILGVLWWKLFELDSQASDLKEEVALHAPSWEMNSEHFKAWDELYPVVTDKWPLQIYKECVMAMPAGQTIRYTNVNVQNGFIELRGNALGNQYLNLYKPKLKNAEMFTDFEWDHPPAIRDPKTQLWRFTYKAMPAGYQEY